MKAFLKRMFFITEFVVVVADVTIVVASGARLTFADFLTLAGVVLFLVGPLLKLLRNSRNASK